MKKIFLIAAALAVSSLTFSCGAQTTEKYKEVILPSPEGKEVKLSEVVKDNKYTLLDFWASWCGPCMNEMSYLRQAYADYKGKGFEIYAVSYDGDGEAWKNAIADEKMVWVHVSSLNGWDCPTQPLYNVRSIPRNFLIDSKGNIVAQNLRGAALSAKLAELMK